LVGLALAANKPEDVAGRRARTVRSVVCGGDADGSVEWLVIV